MKRAVSISLGTSRRNKTVDVRIFEHPVRLERIGTDGDVARATQMFTELDGQVEALGVGGMDLAVTTPWGRYPIHAAQKLVAGVRQTPVVDGSGLKHTLETQLAPVLEREAELDATQKRALLVAAVTRFGMTESFEQAGFECVYGDLMFALGLPIPVRGKRMLELTGRLLLPLVAHMPMEMLYPIGPQQDEIIPRFARWYEWATVIAGDYFYIHRHLPERLDGKCIVTNTTTEADVKLLRQRGARLLVTSTPIFDGRSFGTNLLEAGLTAAAGYGRALTHAELSAMLAELKLEPQVLRLT